MSRALKVLRAHPTATPLIIAIALFALIALLLTWPIGPLNTSHLPDGGQSDQGAAIWALGWIPFALRHGLNIFHTNYIDYPTGANLADTPPTPLLGILVAPITLTLGPVAAFNSLMFLAFVSSAGSMFAVLRQWCQHLIPAFLGGLFFGFSPYMVAQSQPGGHVLFLFMALVPWIVWCLYDLFIARRHRPLWIGMLLSVLATAQAFVSLEVLGDLVLVTAIGMFVAFVLHPRQFLARLRHIWAALIPGVVVFVPVVGWQLWWAAFGPDHIVGPTQPINALQADRVNLFGPIVPLTNQLVAPTHFSQLAATWVDGNLTENGAYLGISLVVFLVVMCAVWRKDLIVRIAGGLSLVAFILSLGNRLDIGDKITSIPLPEALVPHISLLDNTVPARFSIIVAVFAAILLGVGIDRTWDRLTSLHWSSRRMAAAALSVGVLVAIPLVPRAPLPSQTLVWPSNITSSFDAIPTGSVVLTYPYPMPHWPEAMAWQAISGMRVRLLGGYVNVREPDGSSSIEAPLLLDPSYVEEFLTQSQFGAYWFAPVGAPNAQDEADLCTFIHDYSVGAVVAWDAGANPQGVENYFTAVLGAPTLSYGEVLTWLKPGNHCTK